MTEYPQGAIQTTDELRKYLGKNIWQASRTYQICTKRQLQTIGIDPKSRSLITKKPYAYWTSGSGPGNADIEGHRHSRVDHNIDALNGYNDWFLFHKEEDARAYVNRTTTHSDVQRTQSGS